MTDLLDAIIQLCDTLLTPFTGRGDARLQRWMKIVSTLIALAGVGALILWLLVRW